MRALIAARSPADRELLARCLAADPLIVVVAAEARGHETVAAALAHRPDIVLLDAQIAAPTVDEVTRQIMAEAPTPIMILLAPRDTAGAERARSALGAGALVIAEMPNAGTMQGSPACDPGLLTMTKAMAAVKVVRRRPIRPTPVPGAPAIPSEPARAATRRVRIVVIASSTGGPGALRTVLAELPPDFPAPVLVVQHISRSFVGTLVQWLAGLLRLRVRVAQHGDALVPGTVYFAPDDWHLGVRADGTVQLSADAEVDGFRPSATHLFESAARAYGATVLAVVLTGMGRDGVEGLHPVREAGGRVLAQDEASSVVFGMPGEAARAGVVDEVLPVRLLGRRIIQLVVGENDAA